MRDGRRRRRGIVGTNAVVEAMEIGHDLRRGESWFRYRGGGHDVSMAAGYANAV